MARPNRLLIITRSGTKETEYKNRWIAGFKKTPPDPRAGYFLAEYYARRGQPTELRTTLEKLVGLNPDDYDLLLDLVKNYRTGSPRKFDEAGVQGPPLTPFGPTAPQGR